MRVDARDAGVGNDEWQARVMDRNGVEEPLAVDVSEIDEDPLLIEATHVIAPEVREPAPGPLERRARHTDPRGREVHERDAEDDVVGDEVERVEALIEGVAALYP